jgi:sulfide:quinone oxidoreductase
MPRIIHITQDFAVAGALEPDDFAQAAASGFRSIVSNLPDGEQAAQLTAAQEAEFASRAGLRFRHIPTTKRDVLDARVVGDPKIGSWVGSSAHGGTGFQL